MSKSLPVTYKSDVKCDICHEIMQDVAIFDAGFFIQGSICDSCTSKILRGFDPKKSGKAHK